MKILLIGDIHIGRRPRGLPENLTDYQLSVSDLTPAAAWHQAVRFAKTNGVSSRLSHFWATGRHIITFSLMIIQPWSCFYKKH